MAFTNYTTLQAALKSALHRSDLATSIPDFISLAEDKLNKRLRIRAMEVRVTASVSTEYAALPSDFLAMRNFQLNTSPVTRLEYASPEYLDVKYGGQTGSPRMYTFVGGQIQIGPKPDGTYTAEMDYYAALGLAASSTNWLLTNAPRCYYYGALMEASAFLVNDRRVPLWAQMFETAINEVTKSDESDSYPDYGLQIRPDAGIT